MLRIPGYRDKVNPDLQWLLDNVPYCTSWFSFDTHVTAQQLQFGQERDPEWIKNGGEVSKHNDAATASLKSYLHEKVGHDPKLLKQLQPPFRPSVRRLVIVSAGGCSDDG
jgi:hypothetical protein